MARPLHVRRGIRLGIAVGIELFIGYELVAPLGRSCDHYIELLSTQMQPNACQKAPLLSAAGGPASFAADKFREASMWAAFTSM